MRDDQLTGEAKRLIDAIAATPRFVGSEEEAKARQLCADELRSAGFSINEREFEFSEWPGRWGIPLISGWLLATVLVMSIVAPLPYPLAGRSAQMIGILLVAAGMVVSARWRNSATTRLQWLQSRSVNLETSRGTPRVWLVAHLDSKSQSIPMLLRVASSVALTGVAATAFVMTLVTRLDSQRSASWRWIAIAGIVAGLPSLLCFVGNRSRGALDNATGVAAVLLAARLLPKQLPVGVLITSGEELDLAGARAWAGGALPGALMINCDTIDEEGVWRCMSSNRPHLLGMTAEKSAKKLGLALRRGNVIPGIITDSVAFEAAGLSAVTISRGTVRTLARLHTQGDNPDRVSGAGAAMAARLLAQMVEELS